MRPICNMKPVAFLLRADDEVPLFVLLSDRAKKTEKLFGDRGASWH